MKNVKGNKLCAEGTLIVNYKFTAHSTVIIKFNNEII